MLFPEGPPDETAVLLFTAGTTGQPKAVMLSHDSFTSFMLANMEPPDPDVEERTLLTLPLYHVAGLQAALAGVFGGRTVVLQRQFEPREWMALVQERRIERALIVPTMLKQILDHPEFAQHDLSSLRVLTYGGASMPPPVIERAVAAMPGVQFINAFGQTETGSTIAMVPPEDHVLEGPPEVVEKRRRHLRSIGRPLPDVEVRIVGEDGHELPAGEHGEIAARGPRLMRGYWGQPEATAQAVHGGWLFTGDLGYVDEDGYVYLTGRAKDFIKRGGEMVAPGGGGAAAARLPGRRGVRRDRRAGRDLGRACRGGRRPDAGRRAAGGVAAGRVPRARAVQAPGAGGVRRGTAAQRAGQGAQERPAGPLRGLSVVYRLIPFDTFLSCAVRLLRPVYGSMDSLRNRRVSYY